MGLLLTQVNYKDSLLLCCVKFVTMKVWLVAIGCPSDKLQASPNRQIVRLSSLSNS